MIPRKIYGLYFSATGTTEKIVSSLIRQVGKDLGVPVCTLDITLPGEREKDRVFAEGDLVVIGMPVYAGRVPNVLVPYLRKKLFGNAALAVPVVVYGNRSYDDALIELREIVEENGFHTIGAAAFIGEHSFSYELAVGRPDEEDIAKAEEFADRISEKIRKQGESQGDSVKVKGELPFRPYYTPRDRQGRPVTILKVKPKTKGSCTRCGLCASICPMGSINAEDVSQVTGICIKCGACIKKCPTGSKYYDDEGYLYHRLELEAEYTRRGEPETFIE